MLEKVRKPTRSRSIVTYLVYGVIFGMIIASFVFMIPGLGGGGFNATSDAALVGDQSISRRDYVDRLRDTQGRYSKIFGGEIPEAFRKNLGKQVIESLVRNEVLSNYAAREGLLVADVEVGHGLREAPGLQEDGVFSRDMYDNYLRSRNKSARQFEQELKKEIRAGRLQEYLSDGVLSTAQEEELSKKIEGLSLEFEFVKIDKDKIKKEIKVDSKELEGILGSPDELVKVKEFYELNKSDYRNPAQFKARQILFRISDGKEAEAKKKAEELLPKLTSENFADLAKANSEDPLTKENGGDLGLVSKGELLPELEDEAFKMNVGSISSPIKTESGFVILLLEEKKEESFEEFEKVKNNVVESYALDQAVKNLVSTIDETLKGENPQSVTETLKSAGLAWEQGGKFSLTDKMVPKIGESDLIGDAILDIKEVGAIYPKALSFQGTKYLLKLAKVNEVEKDKTKESATSPSAFPGSKGGALSRSKSLVDSIFKKHQEKLKVRVNPQLFES